MILFITRKYPPSVGGMQKQSFELTTVIKNQTESYIIAWGRSQVFLLWFIVLAFTESCWILLTKNIQLIHLGDALLSPLGYVLRAVFRIPVIVTVHGLDVVFRFKPYQMIMPWFLKRIDKIICVSDEAKKQVLSRGVSEWKTRVIPNGISIGNCRSETKNNSFIRSKRHIEKLINQNLNGKTILLTVGRLVKRKGVNYFIREILPEVLTTEKDLIYFVVGNGPYKRAVEESITKLNFHNQVFLLGQVDKNLLDILYRTADIFVMPNIPVEGDVEGFGLVALEANLAGLPVIASDLEGIKDAVIEGQNGFLIDSMDKNKFVSTIINLIRSPSYRKEFGDKARQFTISHYSWQHIGERYLREFEAVIKTDH